MSGKLYLIPNALSEENFSTLSPYLLPAIQHIRHFVVEEEKSARKLLKILIPNIPVQDHKLFPLNEHTAPKDISEYLKVIQRQDAGIISESGCPCVADPGSDLVFLAHCNNIEIIPLVGPSSILLALMASGLNGQNFAFVGYLPKEKNERSQRIRGLETRSKAEHQTQIFMDAPYRNQNVFEDLLSTCSPETFLSIAVDLTSPQQYIKTLPIKEWKRTKIDIQKKPALFLIQKK